jgi:hypothetical protein
MRIWQLDYLQNYLDEFFPKHNRSYFGENVLERALIGRFLSLSIRLMVNYPIRI